MTRLLLDTDILLRALIAPSRLSATTRALLEDPGNDILYSAATIWQLAVKAERGAIELGVPAARIRDAARQAGFNELPLSAAAALRAADLPPHHADPFDRLLVAQALLAPAVLLTANPALTPYSADLVRLD